MARILPARRPSTNSINDSSRIWYRIAFGFMPRACIRPISRTRSNTAIISVLTSPKLRARKMTTTHTSTNPSMTPSIESR